MKKRKGVLPNYNDPTYRDQRKKALKKRLRLRGQEGLDTFDGLAAHAMQGNAEPLLDYIRSQRSFSIDERKTIAWLIGVAYQHGKKGHRKRRSKESSKEERIIAIGPHFDNLHGAAEDWRLGKQEWIANSPGSRTIPKEESDKILRRVMTARRIPFNDPKDVMHPFEKYIRNRDRAPKQIKLRSRSAS